MPRQHYLESFWFNNIDIEGAVNKLSDIIKAETPPIEQTHN